MRDRGPFARVPARRLRRPVLRAARFHGLGDPRGGRGGLEREPADRRLAREHDAVGAVQHRVRDVGGLGARGPGRADHRLQHLRGDDRRAATAARAARSRSFWSSGTSSIGSSTPRSPRATITASVTSQDLLDVLHGRLRLDLRHDRDGALAHQRPQLLHVLGVAHERLRHQVDAQVERAAEPLAVALGDRRQAETLGGDVHPLAGANGAAAHALRSARSTRRCPTR